MKVWHVEFSTDIEAYTLEQAIEIAKQSVRLDGEWSASCIGDNGDEDKEGE